MTGYGSTQDSTGASLAWTLSVISSEGTIAHSTRRLIAYAKHLCPCGRSGTTPAHAHDPIASQALDQEQEGDRLLEGGLLLRAPQRHAISARAATHRGRRRSCLQTRGHRRALSRAHVHQHPAGGERWRHGGGQG